MRWVLMLFVVLPAVMGGEAGVVVSDWVGNGDVAWSDCGDRRAVFSGGTSVAEYTVPSAPTVQHVRGHDLGGGAKGLLNEGGRH